MSPRGLVVCALLAALSAPGVAAPLRYLDDANIQPDAPTVSGNFPKVALTETQSVNGTVQEWSRYDVIGGKAGMASKIAAAQAVNPELKFHFSFHPRSYLGYLHNDPCEIALGMPFNQTGSASQGCSMFAGHWLYRAGTTLTSGIGANQTDIRVADASRLSPGDYVVIYNSPAGSFVNAEHARVQSVDTSYNPDRVILSNRGYKSNRIAHSSNSIIAAHEVGRAGDNRNWAYNLATNAPRDGSNRTAANVMADWIVANWTKNSRGQNTSVRPDGVYFDEDGYILFTQQADVNNDLQVDNGVSPSGTHWWGDGLDNFYQSVRNRVGSNKRVVGGWRESRGLPSLNGVQMENWLVTGDDFPFNPNYRGNGGALSQFHNYQIHNQFHRRSDGYTETLTKHPSRTFPGTKNSGPNPPVPSTNASFRFGFGMTLLADGHYARQNSELHPAPWYDEYAVNVTPGSSTYGHAIASNPNNEAAIRANKGWLGRPLGPRERIYSDLVFASQNNLVGNGSFDSSIDGWQLRNLQGYRDTSTKFHGAASLRTTGHSSFTGSVGGASIRGPLISMVQGREYTLSFAMRSSRPRDVYLRLDYSNNQGLALATERWTRVVWTMTATSSGSFRPIINLGRESSTVWIDDVHVFDGDPNLFRRDFDNGVVVVNATPKGRTVSLGESLQRIRGTGQDSINNGGTVNSVYLPPYDAAILVRRDGVSPPPPPPPPLPTPGACGAPTLNTAGTPKFHAWKDTCTPGLFHVVGTSNGPLNNYVGRIISTSNMDSLIPNGLEANDTVQSVSRTINFNMSVSGGLDGFRFTTSQFGDVCISLSSGQSILFGPNEQSYSGGVNFRQGSTCTNPGDNPGGGGSAPAPGAPSTATTANPGLYAWQQAAGSNRFFVRGTSSNGNERRFVGRIRMDSAASSLQRNSVEAHDSVNLASGSRLVDFNLRLWGGKDEFSFVAPASGRVCLIVYRADGPVKVGANATTVSSGYNLRTGQACSDN